jgi:H+-transporting ATPase
MIGNNFSIGITIIRSNKCDGGYMHPNIAIEEAKKSSVKDLVDKLSSSKDGLSTSETEKRLKEYGANEIVEEKINPLIKFLGYFWGPIP